MKRQLRKAREDAKKKYKEKLDKMTPEEREAFLKEKEEHARKLKLIHQCKDKLTGLSKRIPLMMYGANVEDFKEVTIDNFTTSDLLMMSLGTSLCLRVSAENSSRN